MTKQVGHGENSIVIGDRLQASISYPNLAKIHLATSPILVHTNNSDKMIIFVAIVDFISQ